MDVSAEALAIGAGLVIFGIAFDRAVTELESRPGGHEGFTSLLVVVGVAMVVYFRRRRWLASPSRQPDGRPDRRCRH